MEPFRTNSNLAHEINRNSMIDIRRDSYIAFCHAESCNMRIAAHVTDPAGDEAYKASKTAMRWP